jgi:hypothetical protein
MGSRVELQTLLSTLDNRIKKVYYQPPDKHKIQYPCIIYKFIGENNKYANNKKYMKHNLYEVTVIDQMPDSPAVLKMGELPMCVRGVPYVSDGLNHDVFRLYF